jgi:hypothetical protein
MNTKTAKTMRLGNLPLVLLLAAGCGADTFGSKPKKADAGDDGSLIGIPTGVEEDTTGGLGLATSASKFSIDLTGCASGYVSTATEASPDLQAYKFDRTCLAKLTSMDLDGIHYVPSTSAAFTTYAAGNKATFVDAANPSNSIRVAVTAQLSNPIKATDKVAYTFSQIAAGSDTTISADIVGAGHGLAVSGQLAPSFKVSTVAFTGITTSGAGQFQFGLECKVAVDASGNCVDAALTSLTYKLVEDTYGSTLTLDQATAIFATTGSSVVAADVVAVGNASMPNGGFNTKAGTSALTGPAKTALHPQLLLIVRSGTSYQFFKVNVSSLMQQ